MIIIITIEGIHFVTVFMKATKINLGGGDSERLVIFKGRGEEWWSGGEEGSMFHGIRWEE